MEKFDPRNTFSGNEDVIEGKNTFKSIMNGDTSNAGENGDFGLGGDVDLLGDYNKFTGIGNTLAKQGVASSLTGLQQQVSGSDETMDRIQSSTMKGLQAQQGSQQQALSNLGAQQGLSSSQQVMQGAMLNRQQESAQAGTLSQLATQRAERQRTAATELGTLANQANANDLKEAGMELADKQFLVEKQLVQEELNQNKKIAIENLKSSEESQKLDAAKALVDTIKSETLLQYEYAGYKNTLLTNEILKDNIYDTAIGNLDATDSDFVDNANSIAFNTYNDTEYGSYEELKSADEAGTLTEDGKALLAKIDGQDYDEMVDTAWDSQEDNAYNKSTELYKTVDSSSYTEPGEGYTLFSTTKGENDSPDVYTFKDPQFAESSGEAFWAYKEGRVKKPGTEEYYESKQDFIDDIASKGTSNSEFKSYTDSNTKGYFQDESKVDFDLDIAAIDEAVSNGTMTEAEGIAAKKTITTAYNSGQTYNQTTSTVYVNGEPVEVLIDTTTGDVIDGGGLEIVDGQIAGMVDFGDKDIIAGSDGIIDLSSVYTEDESDSYKESMNDMFDMEYNGGNGNVKKVLKPGSLVPVDGDISFKFKKDSSGRMTAVVYKDGEEVTDGSITPKDITNLPGYESYKESLKASDPLEDIEDGEDYSNLEENTEVDINGTKYTVKSSEDYIYDPSNISDTAAQIKFGSDKATSAFNNALNKGELSYDDVKTVMSMNPDIFNDSLALIGNTSRPTGDESNKEYLNKSQTGIKGGSGTSKGKRSELDLGVNKGGVLKMDGGTYQIIGDIEDYDGEDDNNDDGEDGFWEANYNVYGQKVKVKDLKSGEETWIYTRLGRSGGDNLRGISIGNPLDQEGFIGKS